VTHGVASSVFAMPGVQHDGKCSNDGRVAGTGPNSLPLAGFGQGFEVDATVLPPSRSF
jgi:hypothetical protein